MSNYKKIQSLTVMCHIAVTALLILSILRGWPKWITWASGLSEGIALIDLITQWVITKFFKESNAASWINSYTELFKDLVN